MDQLLAPSIQQLASDAVAFVARHGLSWYRIPAAAALLLLLLLSLLTRDPKSPGTPTPFRSSDLLYLLAVAIFLFALRWPVLALGDLEGDESVSVSAGLTRYLAPAYGAGLFTGSAGPLLTYPLAALGLFGLRIDYGASKLVSLLLITASSAVLYLTLRTFSETRPARVALLPLLAFFGPANVRWTMSYCSEQWINLLVISAIYFLFRLGRKIGREGANLFGMGLALGLIPLIKWQGMPMAALVVACAIAVVARRGLHERAGLGSLVVRLLPLAVLGLAPFIVWCLIQWSVGRLGYFFETYFTVLLTQATSRYPTTLVERLIALPGWGIIPFPMARPFWVATALFLVPAAVTLFFVQRPRRCPPDLAFATLYLAVSAYAVIQPGGPFSHYMNLLVQPYSLLFMLILCHLVKAVARPTLVMLVFLGVTVPPTMGHVQDIPGSMRFETVPVRARLVDALRVLGVSGSPMIHWGWEYAYYIHTGMSWGTRAGGSHEILEPFFSHKAIFVADYLESLESGRAPVFLDTAMEGATFYKDSALYGHEQVPEVAEAVRRNYFPCAEFQGASLYLHRKRYEAKAEIQAWCAGLPHWRPPT